MRSLRWRLVAAGLSKAQSGPSNSILVDEAEWYKMNYPQQIAFMQSFECSMAERGKKQFLYMDVRSLATGKLLATWTLRRIEASGGTPRPDQSWNVGSYGG